MSWRLVLARRARRPMKKRSFFPAVLKKVFGRFHTPEAGEGMLFWCRRERDRPGGDTSLRFRFTPMRARLSASCRGPACSLMADSTTAPGR